jgi:hypothetical protein
MRQSLPASEVTANLGSLSILMVIAERQDRQLRRRRGAPMPARTERQHATVTTMIDIAERMATQTMLIARRDVVEVGDLELTAEEDAKLAEALLHIDQAAKDLRRLRGGSA